MEIYRDFKELIELFNAKNVEYVIVGGYALGHHGVPPHSRNIEIYVHATTDNAERITAALDAFGFSGTGLAREDFEKPDQMIQLGSPPARIFLITSLEGVSWEQAAGGRAQGEYGGAPVTFLGKAELIANKKAAGRPQDLVDAERLEGPADKP